MIHQNCPKCGDRMHVTVRDERAERHGAKCLCGWEGFVKGPGMRMAWPEPPKRK